MLNPKPDHMQQESFRIFNHPHPFPLESGEVLPGFHLAYHLHGELNARKDNVVWVFHALTANSDPTAWWPGLVGSGKLIDPQEYFIICVNMPGSCYGSVGPLDTNPADGLPYLHRFPLFTIRDMVRAYQLLRAALGLGRIRIGIGGSMGGQQLLQWAVLEPTLFDYIIPIATNAQHSPWGKAFNESQRWCIEADPTWIDASPTAGMEGMKIARSIALLSYRQYETYSFQQSDGGAASYQRYQGEKLALRFNAFSYYQLSRSMDSHCLGTDGLSVAEALQRIEAKALVIGLYSDLLFPIAEQRFLAAGIPGGSWAAIETVYGHDGFLIEYEAIAGKIEEFFAGNLIGFNRSVPTFS